MPRGGGRLIGPIPAHERGQSAIGPFAACHRWAAVPPWGVPEQLPYGEAVPRQYAASGSLLAFRLEPDDGQPVYVRLYAQLREAILTGRAAAGTRLPASRVLAAELGLSRNTVVAAYTRLTDEGYAHARGGAGVYVASVLPEDAAFAALASPDALETMPPVLSARGRQLAAMGLEGGSACPMPFVADVPAFDVFPLESWIRLMARSWRQVQPDMLGYAPAAGHAPLREVIAQNLRATRFLRAAGSDVIMTSGSQQSLDLLARVLLDPGESVWVEEPGYAGVRSAFTAAGARLVPVPVDAEGLSVEEGRRRDPSPRLIFVTPSHQYPLGVTMSMARRVELLAFAQSCGALVVEDDYDSETGLLSGHVQQVASADFPAGGSGAPARLRGSVCQRKKRDRPAPAVAGTGHAVVLHAFRPVCSPYPADAPDIQGTSDGAGGRNNPADGRHPAHGAIRCGGTSDRHA